jgi:AraC family transcriptional regulator of adaptative response / methylphosphotriester-DNA alkyltransferase methyltransferase
MALRLICIKVERVRAKFFGSVARGASRIDWASVTTHMELSIQRPATVRHRTSLFRDAVAIVESEYGSDLSLDDIARRVASSRRQLQRSYAEIGKTTFREHLTSIRMERAAELLHARGMTVRQFAKAFRRHHGLAPSAFREARRFRPEPARLAA